MEFLSTVLTRWALAAMIALAAGTMIRRRLGAPRKPAMPVLNRVLEATAITIVTAQSMTVGQGAGSDSSLLRRKTASCYWRPRRVSGQ